MNCFQNPPWWSENRSVLLSVPHTGLAVIFTPLPHPALGDPLRTGPGWCEGQALFSRGMIFVCYMKLFLPSAGLRRCYGAHSPVYSCLKFAEYNSITILY